MRQRNQCENSWGAGPCQEKPREICETGGTGETRWAPDLSAPCYIAADGLFLDRPSEVSAGVELVFSAGRSLSGPPWQSPIIFLVRSLSRPDHLSFPDQMTDKRVLGIAPTAGRAQPPVRSFQHHHAG